MHGLTHKINIKLSRSETEDLAMFIYRQMDMPEGASLQLRYLVAEQIRNVFKKLERRIHQGIGKKGYKLTITAPEASAISLLYHNREVILDPICMPLIRLMDEINRAWRFHGNDEVRSTRYV